jgi:tetratricopeptide (TPR) repeat protein
MLVSAPEVPAEFWETAQLRDALNDWHMGRVIQAYRAHPWHGRPLPQSVVASWVGLTQTQLSRIENGAAPQDLTKLIQWVGVLRIPAHLLWFKVSSVSTQREVALPSNGCHVVAAWDAEADTAGRLDDVNRREMLRLMSMAGSLLAVPPAHEQLDLERLDYAGRLDGATLDQYAELNAHLWQAFSSSKFKRLTLPLVRKQLGVLTTNLQQSPDAAVHQRLCGLVGDLFQLCGEIFFDSDQYTDAAHCYSSAANASKEAEAFDLWACAMTRHAFIGVYERQFDKAAPLLAGAASLAQRGDQALSTRHWVAAVQAQTYAGLGDLAACERALDAAEEVNQLSGDIHTSGWLRFEGSRLAEERGMCFVELRRPELAEAVLTDALSKDISTRRRGSVLTDLAIVGAQRRDADQLVMYGNAAVDAARQTGSAGYVGRKLHSLRPQLVPFLGDSHVRHLDKQITTLTTVSAS